jgi:cytosine deaminase
MAFMVSGNGGMSMVASWIVAIASLWGCRGVPEPAVEEGEMEALLRSVEARLDDFEPDRAMAHDPYCVEVLREAITSSREGSGAVGAILFDESTGAVVERGRNSQYAPYFRSDMHAEMDLLDRYEDRLRKKGGRGSGADPRRCDGMVLVSSMEPCPMCLTRIINSGVPRMYYLAEDPAGGMVSRMASLPPFWLERARERDFRPASCSPQLREMSEEIFGHSMKKMMLRAKKKGGNRQ